MLDDLACPAGGPVVVQQTEQVEVEALEQLGGSRADDEVVVVEEERQRHHRGTRELGRQVRAQGDVGPLGRVRERRHPRRRGRDQPTT